MYEHYLIDNPPKASVTDPNFDNEEQEYAEEHYNDPEFDAIWETLEQDGSEEFSPIECLDPQDMGTQNSSEENGMKTGIENEWEEV